MCKAVDLTKELYKIYDEAKSSYEQTWKDIQKYDLIQEDILHLIEFNKFNEFEGYMLSKRLKELRVLRRKAKNEGQAPVFNYKDRANSTNTKKAIDKIEKSFNNKKYNPRIIKVFSKESICNLKIEEIKEAQ